MENKFDFLQNEFEILSPVFEVISNYCAWEYSYESKNFKILENKNKLFLNNYANQDIIEFFKNIVEPSEWFKIKNFIENLRYQKLVVNTMFKGFNNYQNKIFFISGKIDKDISTNKIVANGIITDITDYITNESELKKRDSQQSYLAHLTTILLQQTLVNEESFYFDILKKITEVLNIEFAEILKKNNDLSETFSKVSYFDKTDTIEIPNVFDIKNTAAGKAFESSTPVLIQSLSEEQKYKDFELLRSLHIESGIWVVIKNNRGNWGLLGALSTQKNSFSISDASYMQALANIIGTFQDQKISTIQKSKLYEFSELVLTEKDDQEFFSKVLKDGMSILDLQVLGVLFHEKQEKKYKIKYICNTIEIPDFSYFAEGDTHLIQKIYNKDKTISFLKVNNTEFAFEDELIAFNQEFNEEFNIKSGMITAIKLKKKIWGFLIGTSNSYISFNNLDENFFQAISNIIANYLENREREQALEKNFYKQIKLTEFSNMSLAISDEQLLFDNICREVSLLFECEFVSVIKYEPLKNELSYVSKHENGINDPVISGKNTETTMTGYTLTKQELVLIKDLINDPRFKNSSFFKEFHVKSGIICPIKNKGRAWGVFTIFSTDENRITETDSAFIENVSNILGLFLERKEISDELIKNRSYETIARLSSGMAHDFNNYLSIIQGYVDLLRQKLDKSDNKDKITAIDNINSTINKSANLIKQLQTISRNEVIKYSKVNLNHIIMDMENIIKQKVNTSKNKNIQVNYDLADDVSPINGDSTQITQLLLNLVTNAIEAVNSNGKIDIKTRNFLTNNSKNSFEISLFNTNLTAPRYTYISIQDNGIGMEEQFVDKIFTPYLKGKKVSSTTGSNLGLGLSIVYGIVKQMNGQIKATSQLNRGTKFEILFESFNDDKNVTDSPMIGKNSISNMKTHDVPSNLKILIVDDNKDFLDLVDEFLKKNGFTTLTANDGDMALKLYNKNKDIGLIITDVIMPEMDGHEMIQKIRERNNILPIIVVSGNVGVKIDDLLDDKTIFLPKPFSIDVLFSHVSKLTGSKF